MKVIAKQRGFFGKLREPGDEFEVPDGTKCEWFVAVGNLSGSDKAKAKAAGNHAPDLA